MPIFSSTEPKQTATCMTCRSAVLVPPGVLAPCLAPVIAAAMIACVFDSNPDSPSRQGTGHARMRCAADGFIVLLVMMALLACVLIATPDLATITAGMPNGADSLLTSHLPAQSLAAVILATFHFAAPVIAGIDLAMPINIVTWLPAFVDDYGFSLVLVSASLAAMLESDGSRGLLVAGAVLGLAQLTGSFYRTCPVAHQRKSLHVFFVIVALSAFAYPFGCIGVALTISAAISVAVTPIRSRYFNSTFYLTQ